MRDIGKTFALHAKDGRFNSFSAFGLLSRHID